MVLREPEPGGAFGLIEYGMDGGLRRCLRSTPARAQPPISLPGCAWRLPFAAQLLASRQACACEGCEDHECSSPMFGAAREGHGAFAARERRKQLRITSVRRMGNHRSRWPQSLFPIRPAPAQIPTVPWTIRTKG
jgi:hypothetical protein